MLQKLNALWKVSCNSGFYSPELWQACEFETTEVIVRFTEGAVLQEHQGAASRKCSIKRLTQGLRVTAEHGWLVTARFLVTAGADLNDQNNEHSNHVGTPLDVAVYHGHVHVVKHLLDNGARIHNNEESAFGTSTAALASEQGGEMATLIGKAPGKQWRSTTQERTKTQITRVYDDITAVTDNMRDMYLRG
ncbi:hypothetical protein BU25DRAFT_241692 [Macroventuria anomochaeta]|uniref:Uncharacterized protein n=1 Tax=Macroventuria anomochaeta TaxID=301207 RepID=A0ACB6RJC7_9PLEO|nr:uncharacterized protein BU25DRAFT_241692 [Macroventuria anomochaeta]KAF2621203.1 hypothetical protein BU25DRAFT_241692 [Macroventuria anomochaeta]